MELRDNREFRPGAFNQWTSSVSDPNLNDISDRSFAETLISGGIKEGSRPGGISEIYGKMKKEKYEEERIMKRGYEKPGEYYCRTSPRCRGEEKAVQIVMGLQSQ